MSPIHLKYSARNNAARSPQITSLNIIETLKEVSPGKKLEDWELSTEDIRNIITDPRELNPYNYYDSHDLTQSSGEHISSLEEYLYSSHMDHLYITPSNIQG